MSDYYSLRHGKEVAQELGDLISRLELELGRPVAAADLLIEATAESSPLHRFFEWDDRRAATEYRLEQARYILRSIEIALPQYGGRRVRAFIPTAYGSLNDGFVSTERAIIGRPDYVETQVRRLYNEAVRIDDELGVWRDLLMGVPEAADFLESARKLRTRVESREEVKV